MRFSPKTEIGAYIVAAWLILIAITLLIGCEYLDVASHDIVMAIGVTLAKLSGSEYIKYI